jgi:hypothetical protein
MIKADHKRWARLLFNFYIDKQFKKHFNHFYLINEPPAIDKTKGLVVTPNHFSWWDGFLIDLVHRKYYSDRKFYILMLEDQLERYWFFRKLGAYSINLSNPKSIVQTFEYTREIISNEESFVTIYPQGEMLPFDTEPIIAKEGLLKFTERLNRETFILPVAFKIQYNEEKKPDLYARFGHLIDVQTIHKNFAGFSAAFIDNIKHCAKEASAKLYVKDLFN